MKKNIRMAKHKVALSKVLSVLADVDGARRGWIIAAAVRKLRIATIHAARIAGAVNGINSLAVVTGKPGSSEHAKNFVRWKNAPTDVLRAAVLGYYLTHFRNKRSYKPSDLKALNDEAAGMTINNMVRAMENATEKNHYFVLIGSGNGRKITPYGEAVVEALPDMVTVTAVKKAGPGGKRKAAK